ncbi:hypothetical protein FSARC_13493 [Fusarium sarcochroum]|uniref:Uncharacterized protein n=1 Tax=Fusarium sarcochroum TaxID=1208366 RepID=A0A8H4T199_9HYPO|nr:hypothetical protein FSARC_13493 [Fusarium sarcochroum]
MYLSLLPLFALTLGVLATPTFSEANSAYPSTIVDGNGTTIEVRSWRDTPSIANIKPRAKSGGFLDECKDVRYYLGKADDEDPHNHAMNKGYKTSPWLVARCPNDKGELVCTWLELGKCLVNVEGELNRGSK